MLPQNWQLLALNDVGFTGEIPETGHTIAENSFLKAQYLQIFLNKNNLQMPVFADDSGLEVEALNGAPGVDSAIYAGQHGDHEGNNKKLMETLQQITNRRAKFVTVITYLNGASKNVFEGEVTGTIAHEPRGDNGFGYDPLFIPTNYRSTFAELGDKIKNQISHRARAVSKFVDFIKTN